MIIRSMNTKFNVKNTNFKVKNTKYKTYKNKWKIYYDLQLSYIYMVKLTKTRLKQNIISK